ncbi:prepilin-type N-terminal cleavage/methylation domain-containing protein [Deefgea tanakiae]|uniref:Prepilin-type N-terminal cleavage/methylation domain-containing protein n=1 Tax=Deefgea tanakiae TaxID=2865840 RepID=A0ABX8Z278_9NEIS|nr:prepilin-type N-terminal cleavage/methylation domain-containing protein [Deefgea tanakiae]QZA76450.1 prepilin-type N-terminal cleavage/methylation domain-containing protein [Deefgea tanakiae]
MSSQQKQYGISLIEVLVSIVILSLGLLALSGFTGNLYRNVNHAADRSRGLAMAQQIIDNARTKSVTDLVDGADATPADCSTSKIRRYWKVVDVVGGNGVKHLSVNACWTNALGELQTVATSTFIGTNSTGIALGSPPVAPAAAACKGIPYADKNPPYSSGVIVTLDSKDYTCTADAYNAYCGDTAWRPGTNNGKLPWGNGVDCTQP